MGIILAWSSSYPTTKDTVLANFPAVSNGVHDVSASHVNALADAVVAIEDVLGGLRTVSFADPLSPTNGQVLVYNSTLGVFEAADPSGGGTSLPVADPLNPTTGDILQYDGSVFESVPLPPILPLSSPFSPTTDQYLRYNGTNWEPVTAPFIQPVSGSVANSRILTYSSFHSGWIISPNTPHLDVQAAGYSVILGNVGTDTVVGGTTFEPQRFNYLDGSAFTLSVMGLLDAPSPVTGSPRAVITLYDVGSTVGAPSAPVLRGTITVPYSTAGTMTTSLLTLTPVASPAVAGDISYLDRMYEVRVRVFDNNAGSFTLYKVSIKVN